MMDLFDKVIFTIAIAVAISGLIIMFKIIRSDVSFGNKSITQQILNWFYVLVTIFTVISLLIMQIQVWI